MLTVLKGLTGVEVLMDNILVYGEDMKLHDVALNAVIHCIKESGLQLNRSKCVFRQQSVSYFDHILRTDGVKPNLERITAIRGMKPPTNVSELRRILGMINFLSRFIKDLSTVLQPLRSY